MESFSACELEALEDGHGETRLSREKAKRLAAWHELEAALEQGKVVQGLVNGKVKGGLTVMINGIRAFLPGSLVDLRPVKDTNPYEGKQLEFKVIKLDRKRNNVVVSRRAVLEASQGAEREALLSSLQEGAVVKGVVGAARAVKGAVASAVAPPGTSHIEEYLSLAIGAERELEAALRRVGERHVEEPDMQAILDREAHEVAIAPRGQRHRALLHASLRLGSLVAGGALSAQDARAVLLPAGTAHLDGGCDCTEASIRRTIEDGLAFGRRNPRYLRSAHGSTGPIL